MKIIPTFICLALFIASGVSLYYSHSGQGADVDAFRVMSIIGLIVFGIALLVFLDKLSDQS